MTGFVGFLNSRKLFVFTENNDEVLESQVTMRSETKCNLENISMKKIINLLALRTLNLFHSASTYDLEVNSSHCLPHISCDFSSENMVFNQTINLRNTGNCLLVESKATKSWDITEESEDDFNNSLKFTPYIEMHILHIVLCTFPMVPIGRTSLTIKKLSCCW